ncbi:serine/threonine protein kinase [Mycobacterium parmense]|uniref:Uncharacterized protein n=1 Tax=Mycobacterium parmense TaxID=185642 RepID=A0A7I7YYQ8_9MYCO|nr:serine/threonine protein kinase [Mycobacterium parmense]MCV7350492.1 serine/threonine protein kinase [Mycobacterium parmense]ORW48223.1 serine/threonine protein kinase [Mycobacterium parmense]BBZ46083.1 hypothetical protein MPRM_33640 [Mycobacterium parmense]
MSHLTKALRAATTAAFTTGVALAGIATAAADPAGNTGSQDDINALATSLSKGYDVKMCQPAPLTGTVLAELDCGQSPDPNGPAAGVYQLFGSGADMSAAFTAGIKGVSLSTCGDSGQSPGTWHQGSGQAAGQVACGTYENAATITWTTDSKNVLSHVRASNTDVNALYQWWRTNG